MSKSLLNVGSQCFHTNCGEIDFLPIVCRCNQYFCRQHSAPEAHHCAFDPTSRDLTEIQPFDKLRRCNVSDCSQPSLDVYVSAQHTASTCSGCKKSFCTIHRYPSSHSCPSQHTTSAPSKSMAARALLAKNFPASANNTGKTPLRVTKVPTDPVKLAQYRRVELMKMRHRAVPGDPKDVASSAPLDQRLYVRITARDGVERVFWFRKTTIAGRVLDLLAYHTKLRPSEAYSLQLEKMLSDGATQVLTNDKYIADQIENGDTLVIGQSTLKTS